MAILLMVKRLLKLLKYSFSTLESINVNTDLFSLLGVELKIGSEFYGRSIVELTVLRFMQNSFNKSNDVRSLKYTFHVSACKFVTGKGSYV